VRQSTTRRLTSQKSTELSGSDLFTEYLPVTELRPFRRNAGTHSKKQIKQIAESIRIFGFTNPVLIDETRTVLAGHGRLAAAKLLGLKEVPCIRLTKMTAAQKQAYVIADNKLALNAGWDEEILALNCNPSGRSISASKLSSLGSQPRRLTRLSPV
jgi:hypothetical protein